MLIKLRNINIDLFPRNDTIILLKKYLSWMLLIGKLLQRGEYYGEE